MLQKLLANQNNLSQEELRTLIQLLDEEYYKNHTSAVSDQTYDFLKEKLQNQVVGSDLSGNFPKFTHKVPMLSLDNTYTEQDLGAFLTKIQKKSPQAKFSAEPKIDGLSLSAHYIQGTLKNIVTRGNGKVGDDVTVNLHMLPDIPQKLSEPFTVEIRGEVFMTFSAFEQINQSRKEQGLDTYANPRNLASGSLKAVHNTDRKLNVYFYALGYNENARISSQEELSEFFVKNQIPHLTPTFSDNINELLKLTKTKIAHKFPTDGLVFKVNDFALQKELGYTSKSPKWAIAYKFEAERQYTKLLAVETQIGRTGIVTPVAILQPVSLSGTTIGKCSLHNWDYIKTKDIQIGDTVLIEKAGEIIPQVVEVDYSKRTASAPITPPTVCKECSEQLVRKQGEAALRCINPSCPGILSASLEYFISKNSLDIRGLGPAVLRQLIDKKIVRNRLDLFKLTKKDLLQLDKIKDKKADNIIEAIRKATTQTQDKLLISLGIPHVGKTVTAKLSTLYPVENFINLNEAQITALEGIGPEIAQSLLSYFSNPKNKEEFQQLLLLGFKPLDKKVTPNNLPLSQTRFVITGTLSKPRGDLATLLESLGATVQSSITKHTTHLLAGEKAGSKLQKAQKQGITIVDENYLNELLK